MRRWVSLLFLGLAACGQADAEYFSIKAHNIFGGGTGNITGFDNVSITGNFTGDNTGTISGFTMTGVGTTSLPWDNITGTDNAINTQHTKLTNTDGGYSKFIDGTYKTQWFHYSSDGVKQAEISLYNDGGVYILGTDNGAQIGYLNIWKSTTRQVLLRANTGNNLQLQGDNVVISGQLQSDNVAITGGSISGVSISAQVSAPILDNVASPTGAQMYGSYNVVADNITVLLPKAVLGMNGCVQDSGSAHDIIIDVGLGDFITLVGVTGASGVGITNASGSSAGDFVCFVATTSNIWTATTSRGTWASQ